MKIAIILDWVMSITLIISIAYSWRLNKKFMDFKNSKGEFFKLIKSLDETILRAEASVNALRNQTVETSGNLGVKLDEARNLTDDLAFMIDRASVLADKLDDSISMARKYETEFRNKTYSQNQNPLNNILAPDLNSNPTSNNKNPEPAEPKKLAIESLLAKISAVRNKRESVDS